MQFVDTAGRWYEVSLCHKSTQKLHCTHLKACACAMCRIAGENYLKLTQLVFSWHVLRTIWINVVNIS